MSNKHTEINPQARRPKGSPLAWVNLLLLSIIVVACNYIGCKEYWRRDLTEDERYTISDRTINVLTSERIQSRETPVHIIFAFRKSTQNYPRMYSLLEEYVRYGKGKIVLECFDPMRQPNRAREISQIYGVDFKQDLCLIDARRDPSVSLRTFEEDKSDRKHVRIRPGTSFIKYETMPDETRRAVALMMDEVVCGAIAEAVEGDMRHMYVVEGKGGVSRDDQTLLENIGRIVNLLNIQLSWINLSAVDRVPEDAEGLIIISPRVDFTEDEMVIVNEFWEREQGRRALFVALDPDNTQLPRFYRFLRSQGVRPNNDRVLLRDRNRAYYDISAVIPKGLECTKSFWHNTTHLEGHSMSLTLEHGDENEATLRRLTTYPVLMTTADYYGETNATRAPKYDPQEDKPGPLCLAAAVTKGSPKSPNDLSTMLVLANTDILRREKTRAEQLDYLHTLWAWMSNRPEYGGKSSNQDLTMKLDLNRHSRHVIEYLTLIIMPLFAFLIALMLWHTRRH
ncbi:MAG: Gldg family protein [Akkermansiaceae bacterium]|nr:Gldg family protein [Akkermansiaceae bacterium]